MLDRFLFAIVMLALVAVLVANSSKTSDAIEAAFAALVGLVRAIMSPLNARG